MEGTEIEAESNLWRSPGASHPLWVFVGFRVQWGMWELGVQEWYHQNGLADERPCPSNLFRDQKVHVGHHVFNQVKRTSLASMVFLSR